MADGLKNRVAIVTGAASGIGAATVKLLLEKGAKVLAVDVTEVPSMPEIGLHAVHVDLAEDHAADRIVESAVRLLGRLDIVVNNAGIAHNALVETHTDEDWDRVQAVNLRAPFRLCRAAIPYLRASPAGRIVNVASVMADGTDYGLAAYCAAKAGVAGLTRTLALELGKFGITANYVLPGAIRTGMTRMNFDRDEIAEVWAKKAALRRLGEPIDVARAIVFLATDEAGFITGHGLNADGGLMLRV